MTASVICALCGSGTFQTGSGIIPSVECTLCDSGTYQTGSGIFVSVECTLCDAGRYQTGSGITLSAFCTQCDSGSYQTGSGIPISISCTLCDAGTYQTGSGNVNSIMCTRCDAGEYQTGSGITASVRCGLCDAGTYQTGSGITATIECSFCEAGSYQTGSGITMSLACTLCDAGTYQTGSGLTTSLSCDLCDSGTYQTGSGISISVRCPLCNSGTFQTGSGIAVSVQCTLCPSGTYQTGSGRKLSIQCTLCEAGTYETGSGIITSVECTLCNAGTYQTGSGISFSVLCILCDAGTYQSGSGISDSFNCGLCDAGTYQTGSGMSSLVHCTLCRSGTYQTGTGVTASIVCALCDAGHYQTGSGNPDSVMCTMCDPGKYQTGSGITASVICSDCDAGTYLTGSGSTASVQCTLCDAGTYQTGSGNSISIRCHLCDAGTYQTGSGKVLSIMCTLCDSGSYQTGSGISDLEECVLCDAGTYQTGSGVTASIYCTLCDAGSYQTGSGEFASVACALCDAGTYQTGSGLTASVECSLCSAGTFQTGSGIWSSVQCMLCDAGSYQTGSGVIASVVCSLCDSGAYQTGSGVSRSVDCLLCDSGTYQTGSGQTFSVACTLCDSGTYETGSGTTASVLCTLCDAGSYQTGSGISPSVQCALCDPGTYQTGSGISLSVRCTLCNSGTYQTGSGRQTSVTCGLCNAGTFQTGSGITASIQCTLCEHGKYQTGSGSFDPFDCFLCNAGKYQTGSGQVASVQCTACDSGTYQTGSGKFSSMSCNLCDSGSYQTGSGMYASVRCFLCESGTYQTGSGMVSSIQCTLCNPGTYQTGSGVVQSVQCTLCNAGTYQTGSGISQSIACMLCGSGSYQTGSGVSSSVRCTLCDVGTYQTGSGIQVSISCDLCDSGTFQTGSGIQKSVSCTLCDAGTFQTGSGIDSSVLCTACNLGTYQSGSGITASIQCTLCDAGKYQTGFSITASVGCTLCNSGMYQSGSGVITSLKCTLCDAGKYQTGSGIFSSARCNLCDSGTYQTGSGAASSLLCTLCNAGTYQSGSGRQISVTCTLCGAGQYQTGSGISTSALCLYCDSGKYQTGSGITMSLACETCDSGKYQTGSGAMNVVDCTFCDAGTYQTGSGITNSVECTFCDAGTFQTGSGIESSVNCQYCADGTYQTGSGRLFVLQCTMCDAGTYQTGSGIVESEYCVLCDSGTYQTGSGYYDQLSCAMCDAGKYQTGYGITESADCIFCDSGTFQSGSGISYSVQCVWCDSGRFQTGSGIESSEDCFYCAAGTYQTGSGNPFSNKCELCDAGTYQTGSGITASILCDLCDAGTFQTGSGADLSDLCISCSSGTYQTGSGMTSSINCALCDSGTYQTGFGMAVSLSCILCQSGTYLTGSGVSLSVMCISCDSGTYQTGSGITSPSDCTFCGSGTYQSGSGISASILCNTCDAGTYQSGSGIHGSDDCSFCLPGTYQTGSGYSSSQQCLACSAGTYQTGSGRSASVSCVQCDPGTYQTGIASSSQSSCLTCMAGSYQTGSGITNSGNCMLCNAGTYQSGFGMSTSSMCTLCDVGTYQTGSGRDSSSYCLQCSAGMFQSGSGIAHTCARCGAGKYQTGQGETACNNCKAGTFQTGYGLTDYKNCSSCPAGTYQTGEGMGSSLNCTVCGVDKNTLSEGTKNESGCLCNTGFFRDQAGSTCTRCKECHQNATHESVCPIGSLYDSSMCVCNSGFFGDGLANGFGCFSCPAGMFLDKEDCISCPFGSYSQEGSSSIHECLCNPGYFGQNGSACQGCPSGTYKSSVGPTNCIQCPANSSSLASSESCQCNAGFTGDGTSCSVCSAGKYGPGGANGCVQCKVCDSNALVAGACPPGTGPSDGVSCLCTSGFYGNGEMCLSDPLPIPQLISLNPSSGHCVISSQQIIVQVINFPAFYRSDISASWSLAGQTYNIEDFIAIRTSISGNLQTSKANLTLTVDGPANENNGIAFFRVLVDVGMQVMQVSFWFEFKPYIIGDPRISFSSPSFVYELSYISIYLEIQNLLPLTNSTDISVSIQEIGSCVVTLLQSTPTLTTVVLTSNSQVPASKSNLSLVISSLDSQQQIRTVTAFIPVKASPVSMLVADSIYPRSSSAGPLEESSRQVQIDARYLAPNTSKSDIIVSIRSQGIQKANLTVVSVMQVADDCSDFLCSVHNILFMLPEKGNPDGANVTETVYLDFLVSGRLLGSAVFTYISVFDSSIDYITPSSQSVDDANSLPITIFGTNFPYPSCSLEPCADQIASLSIRFGTSNGIIKDSIFSGGLMVLVCLSPPINQSGQVMVTIDALIKISQAHRYLTFPFMFTASPADIYPQDGSTNGNTKVNITAVGWGSVVNNIARSGNSAVFVQFGNSFAFVDRILLAVANESASIITIEARTPRKPFSESGVVSCIFGTYLAPVNSTFSWTYYQPPTILSIVPTQAAVTGVTSSEYGNSVLISLVGFPAVNSITDVDIYFNIAKLQPKKALVISFRNAAAFSILNVSVPSSEIPAASTISVSFKRPNFETRTAFFGTFQYVTPMPEIQSILWCERCNTGNVCLINGLCQNLSLPLSTQAVLLQGGVLTVIVENWYNATLGRELTSFLLFRENNTKSYLSKLSVIYEMFGLYATVGIEFTLPIFTSVKQCSGAVFQVSPTISISLDTFSCVHPTITVSCKTWPSLNDTVCAGPSVQSKTNFSIVIRVAGAFPITGPSDVVNVAFGQVQARAVSIISVNIVEKYVDLLVSPPDFATVGSTSVVALSISTANSDSSYTFSWIFWNAPRVVEGYFDSYGTRIFVTFDQPTNGGGLSYSNKNCSVLFRLESVARLASYPFNDLTCTWSSDQTQLTVTLGYGATIIPSQFLTIRSDIIGSLNELSGLMVSTTFPVNKPKILVLPTISLIGPSSVDVCSPLTFFASSNSARNVSFRWSCANDVVLNQILVNLSPNPTIQLSEGTPEMQIIDKVYIISVIAVDIFGSLSRESLYVTKKSAAAPRIMFLPATLNIFSNQGVLLSAVVEFSSCPGSNPELNFTWSLISGPKLPPDVLELISIWSSSEVYLPSNSLQAGSNYVFKLFVQAISDLSMFSEASVSVAVGVLPVIANIAGGSTLKKYQFSTWSLDASASRDLDKSVIMQQLVYTWKCVVSDGTSTRVCLTSSGIPFAFHGNASIYFESGVLGPTPDYPYVFSVTVQDAERQKPPNTAWVSVFVAQTPVTEVSIDLLSSYRLRESSQVINSNDKLVLYVSCPGLVTWTVQPNLSSEAVYVAFPAGFDNNYFIVDGKYPVLNFGISYAFRAGCSTADDRSNRVYGFAALNLVVNEPPSGGRCFACVQGVKGCLAAGTPMSTVFRLECINWADQDSPLAYIFGFSVDDDSIAWFAPTSQSFVNLVFPSGSIRVFAKISDGLGAFTGIIQVTSDYPLMISGTGASSARSLLQSDQIDWNSAAKLLQDQIYAKSIFDINFKLVSLAYEMVSEFDKGLLNMSLSQRYAQTMLTQLQSVLAFTPKTQEKICAYYVVNNKIVQTPQLLNSASLRLAASNVKNGVSDQTFIQTLDQDCVISAVNVISNVMIAADLLPNSEKLTQENYLFSVNSGSLSLLVLLYSSTLTIADLPFVIQTNILSLAIAHDDRTRLVQPLELSFNNSLIGTEARSALFYLPSLEGINVSIASFSVLEMIANYSFLFSSFDVIPRSPLLSLALSPYGSSTPLLLHLTSEISILIPLQSMSQSDWEKFQLQALCMYWDAVSGTLKTTGIRMVSFNRSFATCASKLLTAFIVAQNTSLGLPPSSSAEMMTTTNKISQTTTSSLIGLILDSVGDTGGPSSHSWAVANMKWVPTVVDSAVFEEALLKVLLLIGSKGNASVALFAIPGLIIKTVIGVSYGNFRASLSSSAPPSISDSSITAISSVVNFTMISNAVLIQMEGIRYTSSRRQVGCNPGMELRYTKIGAAPNFACNCPPNLNCTEPTTCPIVPSQGDQWLVVAVPSSLCASITPVPVTNNNDSTTLGLAVGLGLGLPICLLVLLVLFHNKKSDGVIQATKEPNASDTGSRTVIFPDTEFKQQAELIQSPAEIPLLQKPPFAHRLEQEQFEPVESNSQLVFSTQAPVSFNVPSFETTVLSLEPPLQVSSYWEHPQQFNQHQQETPEVPYMPTYNPYDLQEPGTRRFFI